MKQDQTRVCQFCQSEIPRRQKICPHCHRKESHPFKYVLLFLLSIAIFFILLFNIVSINSLFFGSTKSSPPQPDCVYYTQELDGNQRDFGGDYQPNGDQRAANENGTNETFLER